MAACCSICGCVILGDREAIVVSNDKWYAHRTGACPNCGNHMQWHRPVAGRLGSGYLYLLSPSPSRCSQSCPHYDKNATLPTQI